MIATIVLSGWLTAASWYGAECAGKPTASGQPFNPSGYTCASWDYPLGTKLVVSAGTNHVHVVCNDRGPARRLWRAGRKLDLSEAAFKALAPLARGVITVNIEVEK